MHPRIMAARRMQAGQSIGNGLTQLAALFGVAPVQILPCKDARIMEVFSLEAWAETVTELVAKAETVMQERKEREQEEVRKRAFSSGKGKR